MKWVVVTQWVGVDEAQVPPDQSLASREVTKPRATPVMGCTKPEVAKKAGRVIEPRNKYSRGPLG
jgi:hypothetical protein